MNKKLFKLFRRCHRLYRRADKARGKCMNLRWYRWVDLILETFDEIESMGIDVEDCPYVDQESTPESQLIIGTLYGS